MDKKFNYYDDVKNVIYDTLEEYLNDATFRVENNINRYSVSDVIDKCDGILMEQLENSIPFWTKDVLNHIADNPDLALRASEQYDLTLKDFWDNPGKLDHAMRLCVYNDVIENVVKTVIKEKDLDLDANIDVKGLTLEDIAYNSLKDTLKNEFKKNSYETYVAIENCDLDGVRNATLKNVDYEIDRYCYNDNPLDRILRGDNAFNDYLCELSDTVENASVKDFLSNPYYFESKIVKNCCLNDIDFKKVFDDVKHDVENDIIRNSDMRKMAAEYIISENKDLIEKNILNDDSISLITRFVNDFEKSDDDLHEFFDVDKKGNVSISGALEEEIDDYIEDYINITFPEKNNIENTEER